MQCQQASEMMSLRLDGRLGDAEEAALEAHLAACESCQATWHRLQALECLLRSAPAVAPPPRMRVHTLARLERREKARRTLVGSAVLALGTIAVTLIILAPLLAGLLEALRIAPALVAGGPATLAQLVSSWSAMGRALLLLIEEFAAPLALFALCGLATAAVLNILWIGTLRRLRATH